MRSLNGNWVFIFLGIAAIFIIVKYFFIDSLFIINDLFALLSIVFAVFIQIQSFIVIKSVIKNHSLEVDKLKSDFEYNRKKLLETIDASENKSNEEKKGIVIVSNVTSEIDKISSIIDINKRTNKMLSILASQFDITTGILYKRNSTNNKFEVMGTYAIDAKDVAPIEVGIGLHGQALLGKESRVIDLIPEDYYTVYSGLGESKSTYLYLLPIVSGDEIFGLLELSSFKRVKIDTLWGELNIVIGNILVKD